MLKIEMGKLADSLLGALAKVRKMTLPHSRKQVSECEVAQVFETMGLGTQEKRDKLLSQGLVTEPEKPREARYVTRLSNSSQPEPTED